MQDALVIIDMQNHFINRARHPHYPLVIDNTIKQIALAIRRKDPIIFVEFNVAARRDRQHGKEPSDQPTLQELLDLTADYDQRYFVFKDMPGGGKELHDAFKSYKIERNSVRVCGVYTNACVLSTIKQFVEHSTKTKVKVVRNAVSIGSSDPHWNKEALREILDVSPNISAIGPSLW